MIRAIPAAGTFHCAYSRTRIAVPEIVGAPSTWLNE
jgi:hypothetical protein